MLTKDDTVTITARRWFQRAYGNTYFSCRITVNGKTIHHCPYKYGYGEQWLQHANEWLAENGYTDNPRKGSAGIRSQLWQVREKVGFSLHTEVADVARKKDL